MRILFAFLLLLPLALGCTTHKLDGGSNDTPSSSGSAPADGASQDGLDVTTPASGTIIEQSFTPTAIELRQETKSSRWMLTFHNSSAACAKSTKMGDDVLILTVTGFAFEAEGETSWPLELGDATFQQGLYDPSKDPTTESGTGRLRLEGRPGDVGSTVEGRIHVTADTSEVEGAFTATVCAPR